MTGYSDMMQMCRLCLVKEQVNLPIFGGQGDLQQIFLKITACLPVKVSREDNLPKNICDGCSYKLDLLYQFWNTSSNSEKQLIDWLTAAGVDPKHKSNEPIGLASQPNVILKQEPVTELDAISSETQSYIMQQQQLAYKPEEYDETQAHAKSTKNKATTDPADESLSKRPRRATRNTQSVREVEDDSEDDYLDNTDTGIAKTEDESDEDDDDDDGDMDGDEGDDMADPDFVAVDADDSEQPGPSGVSGPTTTTGPSSDRDKYESYKTHYGLKECIVFLGKTTDFDPKLYRFMKTQAYCDVDQTNILPAPRLKYKCDICTAKFRDHYRLKIHMDEDHAKDETSSVSTLSSEDCYEPEEDEEEEEEYVEKPNIKYEDVAEAANNTESLTGPMGHDFKCVKCFKIFIMKEILMKHLMDAHKVFACTVCPQMYYSKTNLDDHMKNVHKNIRGRWRCVICSTSFSEYYQLIEHNFAKHKPSCHLCKKDFTDLQTLIQHKVQRHAILEDVICKQCGLETPCKASLQRHMQLHRKSRFDCNLCKTTLESAEQYIEHIRSNHAGKEPSPRVLNHSQQLPSIKMTLTKKYPTPNTTSDKISYVVSQPSTSGTVPATGVPGVNPVTSNKKIFPNFGPSKTMVLKNFVSPNVAQPQAQGQVQVQQATSQAGTKEAPKLIFVDKNTNKAYLIPGIMVQQNGQMKLTVQDGISAEGLAQAQPLGNFLQPITTFGQPTIANFAQPTISNIGQPTISNIVQQPMSTIVQPSQMASTFVMPSVQNTAQKLTLQLANNMSTQLKAAPKPTPKLSNPTPKSTPTIVKSGAQKKVFPRLLALPVKQYKGKQIPLRAIRPNPGAITCEPSPQNTLVLSDARSEAVPATSDIAEMPKLEIQSSEILVMEAKDSSNSATSTEVKESAEESIAPPTLIPEIGDSSAGRPKIFLKPISQLLEKPKVHDVVSIDLDEQPSTSQTVAAQVKSSKMAENVEKVSLKFRPIQPKIPEKGNDKTICTCSTCGLTFKRLSKLQLHQTKMKCKLCSYTGCRLKALDAHYKVVHQYKNQCVTCDTRFPSAEALKDHNKHTHLCLKCNKLYPSMERHSTAYVCLKCNEYSCTSNELSNHYYAKHQLLYHCIPCKLIFQTESTLIVHKRNVHYCNKCGSFKMDLAVHQQFCKV